MNYETFILTLLKLAQEIAEKSVCTSVEEEFLKQMDIFVEEMEKRIECRVS